jgi:hypothetical protein
MLKQVNGWQRAGIILSILWAIGAGIHVHNTDLKGAKNFADLSYKVCTNEKLLAHDSDLSSCERERQASIAKWLKDGNSNANIAFLALVPIPFGWLAGFILFYFVRAQIAGFCAVVPWATLSRSKKLFVAFCAVATVAAILLCVTTILNLYVDTKVPVSLSPFKDVTKGGDDFVTVAGTWTRTDLTGDTIANPLQASKIECSKQERKCVEAKAYVSGDLMLSDLSEYNIRSWTADSIVFEDDEECSATVYTIDLNTNTVSGAGHLTNQDTISCRMNFNSKENWSFLLTNGFNVYWEQRKNARPMLLRVIQAPFGS